MQKIYINTRKREFYDATGCRFASGYPKIAYKRSERFAIQLCVESPGAETEGCDPEEWEHDTQFNIPGITALLSVDNDFRRRRKGTLETAVSAGNVSTITANFDGASATVIRKDGVLQLFSDDGESEGVQYTGFSVSGNSVTFTLAENSSLAKNYDSEAQSDVPDAIYMQAAMSVTDSKPEDGLFVFDLVAYSPKLRAVMEYADIRKLDTVAGMEILLFSMGTDGTRTECDSYLCETCSVTATMAEANPNPQLPDTARDTLSGLVSAVMSNGMEAEFSADGVEWHSEQNVEEDTFVHFRLKGTSYGWSTPMNIPRGVKGEEGAKGADGTNGVDGTNGADAPEVQIRYSADGISAHDGLNGKDIYLHFSFNGGTSWTDGIQFRNGTVESYPEIKEYDEAVKYPVNSLVYFGDPAGTYQSSKAVPAGKTPLESGYWKLVAAPGSEGKRGVPGSGSTFTGEYDESVRYDPGDTVQYGGVLWYCLYPTTGNPPPELPLKKNTYWEFYLDRGPAGQNGTVYLRDVEYIDQHDLNQNPRFVEISESNSDSRIYDLKIHKGATGAAGLPAQISEVIAIEADRKAYFQSDSRYPNSYILYIPKGARGESGSGLIFHAAGTLADRHEYDKSKTGTVYIATDIQRDENGQLYQNYYFKKSDESGDWSDGIRGYMGRPGKDGAKGEDGEQGPPGENAAVIPDEEFVSSDIYRNSLIVKGIKRIAQIEVYGEDGYGHTVPVGSGKNAASIITRYTEDNTYILFGSEVDYSRGGRVRFAQGLSGQSEYQMWLGAGHDGTQDEYIEWLRGEGLKIAVKESDLTDGKFTVKPDCSAVGVIDDSGKEWNFADGEIVHLDTAAVFDFSGIKSRKGVSAIDGTWKLVVNSGRGEQGLRGEAATMEISEHDTWIVNGTDTGKRVHGNDAMIEAGKVAVVESNKPATVKNSGTQYNAIFDFEIPQGPKGERGDGLHIDASGRLNQRHVYDKADAGFCYLATDRYTDENGHEYNLIYQKRSAELEDWSDGAILYMGQKGDTGPAGPEGKAGPRGENAELIQPFLFEAEDVKNGAIVLDGTKPLACVEIRDTEDNLHNSFIDVTCRVTIRTREDEKHTVIYFGDDADTTHGGRIRFAQGIGGETQYQIYIRNGGTLTYDEWYQAAVVNPVPEAPKDGHFYCRKDGVWVAVNVAALGDVTVSGTRSYTRTESVGSMFSLTFDAVASDGSAVAITLKSGTVPNGLSLSGKTLSGTPTAEGNATLVFTAASGAAIMEITVSLTIQKEAVMYYGYVAATNSMYKVTSLTAAALSASTVKSATAGTKDKTSLGDAPAGSLIFVLLPKSANLKAVKFDGISGWCEFEENRGANGTGTNGAEVTIAGTVYRVYGEATLVDSETFIKVETI